MVRLGIGLYVVGQMMPNKTTRKAITIKIIHNKNDRGGEESVGYGAVLWLLNQLNYY
jgi:hypothetical protein